MYLFEVEKNAELIQFVKAYYDEPHRVFHGWKHIQNGFELARELAISTTEFELNYDQQMAWLFHDIVYIPKANDNERNSVVMMNHIMSLPQFAKLPDTRFTEMIIMSTAQHFSTQPISAAVLDLDMSCFAFNDQLRKANCDIMEEFNLKDFQGRIAFLEDLDTKQIYQTEWCKKHWEEVAHRNIRQTMIELEYA